MKQRAADLYTGISYTIDLIQRLRHIRISGYGRVMYYRYNSYIAWCITIHPFTDPMPSYVYTRRHIYPFDIR